SRQIDETLLRRTAGPYMWAKGSGPIKNPTDSNQSRTTVRRGSRGRSPGLPLINSARSPELRKFDSSRRRKLWGCADWISVFSAPPALFFHYFPVRPEAGYKCNAIPQL